jgi:hypothetical protein
MVAMAIPKPVENELSNPLQDKLSNPLQNELPKPPETPTKIARSGVPTFQEFYNESLKITQANKGTIIDIFDIIKTRTGKTYKDIRGDSTDLVVLRAQKLLIALFLKYQLDVFLLCFYLKLPPPQINTLWRSLKSDIPLQSEVELAHAIICGRIMGITEPAEGVVIFIAHINQWFCNLRPAQRVDLHSYIEGTLTNTRIRIDQMSAIRGLYLISQQPKIRSQFIHYLSLSGLSNYVGLIEPQIRRAGYVVVPQGH